MPEDNLRPEHIQRRIENHLLYAKLFSDSHAFDQTGLPNETNKQTKVLSDVSPQRKFLNRLKNAFIVRILQRVNLTLYSRFLEVNKTVTYLAGVISSRDQSIRELGAVIISRDQVVLETRAVLADRDQGILEMQATLLNKEQSMLEMQATLLNKEQSMLEMQTILADRDQSILKMQAMLLNKDQSMLEMQTILARSESELASQQKKTLFLEENLRVERDILAVVRQENQQNLNELSDLRLKLEKTSQTLSHLNIEVKSITEKLDEDKEFSTSAIFCANINENDHLCFIHIPKTAGTSFVSVLRSLAGDENFYQVPWQKLVSRKFVNLDKYKAISGHFPYEIVRLFKTSPQLLTFLRDPIERAISQFVQSKTFPSHWAYEKLQEIDLDQYMEHQDFQGEINNVQTWSLGLQIQADVHSLMDLMTPRKFSLHVDDGHLPPVSFHRTVPPLVGRQFSVAVAEARLKDMSFIGITERFRDSMNLFSYTFGTPVIKDLPHLRRANHRLNSHEISDATLRRLSQLNEMDVELYDYAKNMFDERYKIMVDDLKSRYISRNQSLSIETMLEWDYWLAFADQNPDMMDAEHYQPGQSYPRSGWYGCEKADGRSFMWSGPGTISTITLPLNRSLNLKFEFRMPFAIDPEIANTLKVFIDDQLLEIESYQEAGGAMVFSGRIANSEMSKFLWTKIDFSVDYVKFPSGSSDRLLGFALEWASFTPIR